MTPETIKKCSRKQVEILTLSLIRDIYHGYETDINQSPLAGLIFSGDNFCCPAGVSHSVSVNHYNPFNGNFDSISVLFMCDTGEVDIAGIWEGWHPAHKVTIKVRSALEHLGWKVTFTKP
jgi:hypothetical protein